MAFALFFLGEYAQHDPDERDDRDPVPRRLAAAVRGRAVHLGPGPDLVRCSRSRFVLFCFLWVRATFPRYRYDQLMRLGWKVFLPFSLFWLVLTAGVLTVRRLALPTALKGSMRHGISRHAAPAASCSDRAGLGLGADLALHVQAAR